MNFIQESWTHPHNLREQGTQDERAKSFPMWGFFLMLIVDRTPSFQEGAWALKGE